jgi:hypothetical protein
VEALRDAFLPLLDEGRGVIIAAAHIGPLFAGPLALQLSGLPFRWLASIPGISGHRYADTLISTSDQSEVAVAKRVMQALDGGHCVIIAADGAMSPGAPKVEWEGAAVTFSDFAAGRVFRGGVPSVFGVTYWEGGRIKTAPVPLPRPEAGEDQAGFSARWRRAYFDQIELNFRREPKNLRLGGGIWRGIG